MNINLLKEEGFSISDRQYTQAVFIELMCLSKAGTIMIKSIVLLMISWLVISIVISNS
jgi:hypothetical protein